MKKAIKLSPEQAIAADPTKNVVVQANAGTGKTFVLVQRLLRILFYEFDDNIPFLERDYRNNKSFGILCLTYTNAGAAEMQSRILSAVMDWARATDDELCKILAEITKSPNTGDITKARQIFYYLIDHPYILKIQTIHSFCESVLRRFPIEAGAPPAWRLVSGAEQKRLLKDSFGHMMSRPNHFSSMGLLGTIQDKTDQKDLDSAFDNILNEISEHSIDTLISVIHSEYKHIISFKQKNININQIIDNTAKFLQVYNPPDRPEFYDKKEFYLKKDGEIRKLGTKKWTPQDHIDAQAVYLYSQYQNNLKILQNSHDLLLVCNAFAQSYIELKNRRSLLDFDDILHKTNMLFQNPKAMGIVLSSLDFNLKYILVDESQDNSPEMWSIIFAMLDNFFDQPTSAAGLYDLGATNVIPRSLFVVGDAKQSIFSFQGANPAEFNETPKKIKKLSSEKMREYACVELNESRRTTGAILDVVDYFFTNSKLVGMPEKLQHKCWRTDDAGLVQIIPKFLKQGDEKGNKTKVRYIREIADKIERLVKEGVSADDIMVLVQRRNPFAPMLSADLKRRKIEVAGSDRVSLPEFSSVRDLLNILRFAINPSDDTALANVLRGPLMRWSEAQLMELCIGRDTSKSLFEHLHTYKLKMING